MVNLTDNNPALCKLKDLLQRYDMTIENVKITNDKQLAERNKQHNIILSYCLSYSSKSLNVATVNYFLKHFKEKHDFYLIILVILILFNFILI